MIVLIQRGNESWPGLLVIFSYSCTMQIGKLHWTRQGDLGIYITTVKALFKMTFVE